MLVISIILPRSVKREKYLNSYFKCLLIYVCLSMPFRICFHFERLDASIVSQNRCYLCHSIAVLFAVALRQDTWWLNHAWVHNVWWVISGDDLHKFLWGYRKRMCWTTNENWNGEFCSMLTCNNAAESDIMRQLLINFLNFTENEKFTHSQLSLLRFQLNIIFCH